MGAEVVFRGERAEVLTGAYECIHAIITRLPDASANRSGYEAPSYQAPIPLRDRAVEMVPIGYEPFDQRLTPCGRAESPIRR